MLAHELLLQFDQVFSPGFLILSSYQPRFFQHDERVGLLALGALHQHVNIAHLRLGDCKFLADGGSPLLVKQSFFLQPIQTLLQTFDLSIAPLLGSSALDELADLFLSFRRELFGLLIQRLFIFQFFFHFSPLRYGIQLLSLQHLSIAVLVRNFQQRYFQFLLVELPRLLLGGPFRISNLLDA